ncbi:MAG: nucleotidyltransferase domain-containing protein [Anaerolineae bacterium]|nr:nucleotidyltransferase domain-containing protein [Anaerolineae bacterium]
MPTSVFPPDVEISNFCKRWKIRELALFGSALRDDFHAASDLDLLVTFAPDAEWGLLDHVQMQLEVEKLFGRSVDLISKRALERSTNWVRREEIFKTAQILYSVEASYATR